MEFFERLRNRSEKFKKYVEEENDMTMIILNSHMFIEELLTEILILSLKNSNPLAIKVSQNMMFAQKLNLVWALSDKSIEINIWSSLKTLNAIRNKMAHSLEPKGIDLMIEDFIVGVHHDLNAAVNLTSEDLDLRSSIGWLSSALGYRLSKLI